MTKIRVGNLWDQKRLNTSPKRQLGPIYDQLAQGMQGQGWNPSMEQNTFDPQQLLQQAYGGLQKINTGQGADVMGGVGAFASAAPDIAMTMYDAFTAPKYDTSVSGGDWTGYNPEMGLGDEALKAAGITKGVNGVITKTTGKTALKMAGTGASIGTAILPGLGTAIGAAAGAIGGAITGFFGGRRKKRKAAEATAKINTEMQNKAEQFGDVHTKARQEYQADRIAMQQFM
jgi:hypothetical protein